MCVTYLDHFFRFLKLKQIVYKYFCKVSSMFKQYGYMKKLKTFNPVPNTVTYLKC